MNDENEKDHSEAWQRVIAMKDGPHHMNVTITPWGRVNLAAVCDAEAQAPCRVTCDQGDCERWPCSHAPAWNDRCNVVDFLNAEDTVECYAGSGEKAISNGMPISYKWEGDDYRWDAAVSDA